MLTRTLLLTALVATASSSQPAVAEAAAEPKVNVVMERSVEAPSFRAEIESYLREVDERIRTTLNEDLKRELGKKIVLGSNEQRTRG